MDSAIEFFCGGAEIRNFFVGCGRVSWMSMWSGITPAEVCAMLEGEICWEGDVQGRAKGCGGPAEGHPPGHLASGLF